MVETERSKVRTRPLPRTMPLLYPLFFCIYIQRIDTSEWLEEGSQDRA